MTSLARGTLLLLLALLLCSSATAAPEDLEERQKEEEEGRELQRTRTASGEGPPQNLTAEGVSESAINVSWSHPEEIPKQYKVFCFRCSTMNDITTDTHYLMEKLEPCEDYDFDVTSHYDTSSPKASTTGSTLSSMSAPVSCNATSDASGDLHVTWKKPDINCPNGDYSISWTWEVLWGDGEQGNDSLVTPALNTDIKNPPPYTNYSIEIFASTIDGVPGPPCYCNTETPEERASAPLLVNVTWTNGLVTAIWDPPEVANGLIIEYGIFLNCSNDAIKTVDGDTTSASVDLEPCEPYGVHVEARNGAGWGQPSDVWEIATMEYGPPQNLASEGVSTIAINVTWSSPECPPKHYQVQCLHCPGEDTTNDHYYLFEDLGGACKTYEVTVIAVYDEDEAHSDKTSGTTLSIKPPEPVDCKVPAPSSNTFDVNWDEPATDCPLGDYNVTWSWEVMWGTEDQGSSFTLVAGTNYTVKNAVPYTRYTVTVAASTAAGYGPPCSLSADTQQDAPGPPSLKLLTEDLTINASWTEPEEKNGIIADYILEWTCPEDSSCSQAMGNSETLSYIIGNLSCGETYEVTVRAKTEGVDEEGQKSAPQTAGIVNSISETTCTTKGPQQVSVEWQLQDPLCPVSGYNLTWSTSVLWSTGEDTGGAEIPEGDDTYILYDLKPYTNVSVCVRVKESSGSGGCCSTTTQEGVPSEPTDVTESEKNSSSIRLHWSLPEQQNGKLTGWRLTWSSSDPVMEDRDELELEEKEFLIVDLLPSTEYTVCVRAKTKLGPGDCGELVVKTDGANNGNTESNLNIGLIVGASVGGVALVGLLAVGGLVLYMKNNKPSKGSGSKSASDKDHRQRQRGSQEYWERKDTVDIGNNRNREWIRPSSPSLYNGRHLGSPVNEKFELEEFKRLPPSVPFENNRYSSQQVTHDRRSSEQVARGRRPSQQVDHGRRSSQQMGYNRRLSQQVDYGQPQPSEYSSHFSQKVDYVRRPSQQVSKLRRQSQQVANGRRSSQQVDYNRRPSQQVDNGLPQSSNFNRRLSQQVDHGRRSSQQVSYSRRPSQQPVYLN